MSRVESGVVGREGAMGEGGENEKGETKSKQDCQEESVNSRGNHSLFIYSSYFQGTSHGAGLLNI